MARSLLAALACAHAAAPPKRVTLAIANERSYKVQCSLGAEKLPAIPARTGQLLQTDVPTSLVCGGVTAEIAGDGYVVARVGDDNIAVGDANEFQLELSRAAHACDRDSDFFTPPSFQDCVFQHAFGGVDEPDARAWRLFWQNEAYWRLCEVVAPSSAVRTFASEAVPGQAIEVLRETPFVAVARGFATRKQCQDIVDTTPAVSGLGRAHVGGTGETSFSSSRETLSTNLDINWNEPSAPVTAMAAVTIELASELLGQRMSKEEWAKFGAESMKIPYEAQEPINFLHYKVGFERVSASEMSRRWRGAGIELLLTTPSQVQAAHRRCRTNKRQARRDDARLLRGGRRGREYGVPGRRPQAFPGRGRLALLRVQKRPAKHAARRLSRHRRQQDDADDVAPPRRERGRPVVQLRAMG